MGTRAEGPRLTSGAAPRAGYQRLRGYLVSGLGWDPYMLPVGGSVAAGWQGAPVMSLARVASRHDGGGGG
ncbi:MAG: hypothetical protein ACXVGR_00440 [Mycobacteriaceae bacterium]